MPLRCVDETGNDVHAFDLSAEEWRALGERNRKSRMLRMPCCSTAVILRRSSRGTQHFAHKAVGDCTTAPETEAHLRLKRIAVEVARKHGWDVKTEVKGIAPTGEEWIADVLAQKNNAKVAVEIQWSSQTNGETMRRQERYRQSGIRCLWLLKKPGFPTTEALPAAQILEYGRTYSARVAYSQEMPVEAFLDAAFGGRFRYGIPSQGRAAVHIRVGEIDCWKRQCGAKTRIVTGIDIELGPHTIPFSVAELGEYPRLFEEVFRHLPHDPNIGRLKRRFSKTQERQYLSNGCYRCDSLVGEFFEFEARYSEEIVNSFHVRMTPEWKRAIEEDMRYQPDWAVYSPDELES
ncbi:competence protein CoiA family protein [Sinorhizobium garamanticum]|uniref:Competence protein CoiA family protein n=1 Tax=Sinorhizobium garamanticum TaxID=680247 RepID=A0ABY8D8D6_9HYPH|nr:competence protein CoiA family protein [Sinorhizobium garamanticum]WEX87156.1 competence protein CoiA family protein [Sinorhizobium garamanticum]